MAKRQQPAEETGTHAVDPELTDQQLCCIEALIAGKTKAAAAEAVGVAAYTVSRWHKEALFVATLNSRRKDIHAANVERLRSLTTVALDVYEEALSSPDLALRLKAAGLILKAGGLGELPAIPAQTDPAQIETDWKIQRNHEQLSALLAESGSF
jgi:hypothetical protein